PARGARRRGRRAAGTSAGAREGSMKRLLIRAPNWIGDAVMSEPAIRHFRATYPDARVTVLARPAIAELLAAHPAIDERIVYDPRRYMGLSGKWRLAEELRNRRFDGAVLLQNAFEAALIAFLARIPFRYGYATDGRQWLLTRSLKPAPRAA